MGVDGCVDDAAIASVCMYSCMDSPLAWRVTRANSRVNTGRDKAVICETETSSVAKLECRLVVSSYRNAGSVPSSPVKPRAGQEMNERHIGSHGQGRYEMLSCAALVGTATPSRMKMHIAPLSMLLPSRRALSSTYLIKSAMNRKEGSHIPVPSFHQPYI